VLRLFIVGNDSPMVWPRQESSVASDASSESFGPSDSVTRLEVYAAAVPEGHRRSAGLFWSAPSHGSNLHRDCGHI